STRSVLAVPLRSGGDTAAVLNLESNRDHYFTNRHVELVSLLAPNVASAVQRTIDHAELLEARERFNNLAQMSRIFGERWDEASLLAEFASRIVTWFSKFDLCVVRTADWDKRLLILRGFGVRADVPDPKEMLLERLPIDSSVSG